ncbi:MAG: elongation factor P [Patescibacteria group bacterium]|jgi:elongation factor P|nr:elongation factor P [Patescibacteria group bacterium]
MLSITELKKGTIFELDNQPYKVVDYSQKVMGRGGSIVNVRIKNLIDNKVLEKTFKGNEQLNDANVTYRNVQFLYNDSNKFYFMNDENFEQYELSKESIGDSKDYLIEGGKSKIQLFNGQPINIELPKNVELKVIYCEDAIKGDTSSAVMKDATLETNKLIKVPAFIKIGDLVSIDTLTGLYRERLK